MHVNTLIELAIQKTERKSLRSLAERIEVSSSKVSEWKTGQAPIPETRIVQLAKLAGQDAGPWLLLIKSDQAEGEVEREWAKLAKRLATTAAAVAGIVVMTYLFGADKGATLAALSTMAIPTQVIHYAKLAMVAVAVGIALAPLFSWWLQLLRLWLSTKFGKPSGPSKEASTCA